MNNDFKKIVSDITEIKNVFDQLKNTSSSNAKVEILKDESDNSLFKTVISFVYDDFIRTGISFKTLNTTLADTITYNQPEDMSLISVMDYVRKHNTGTLSTVAFVQDFISLLPLELQDFVKHIIAKDLKVGITAKSINKAYGKNFIREFNVQLAHPYHKFSNSVIGKEFTLTQKLDGHRAVFIMKDGAGQFYTRKGIPIKGLNVLTEQAAYLADVMGNYGVIDYVLDGELLLMNNEKLETKDLFRATSRVLRSEKADKSNILFNIFDAVPTEQFESGKSFEPFGVRKERLSSCIESLAQDTPRAVDHLVLVKNLYQGSDLSMISKLQHELVEPNGWEGLILNVNDSLYVTKRTNGLLKIKEFSDADVLVTDVFEGTGKLEGTLGGVVVSYKGNKIRVGSGFNDADRNYYWNHVDEIVGHVVQINYFEESKNKTNDKISLRFPTFITVRNDKSVDDISYED